MIKVSGKIGKGFKWSRVVAILNTSCHCRGLVAYHNVLNEVSH